MGIFEKLFYGGFSPQEDFGLNKDQKYCEISDEIEICKDKLKEKLSHEDLKILNDLTDAVNQSISMENTYFFAYGFKLAVMMAYEIFHNDLELAADE